MAHDGGWGAARRVGDEAVQFGTANPDGRHPDHDLSGFGGRLGDIPEFEFIPGRIVDGFHGRGSNIRETARLSTSIPTVVRKLAPHPSQPMGNGTRGVVSISRLSRGGTCGKRTMLLTRTGIRHSVRHRHPWLGSS